MATSEQITTFLSGLAEALEIEESSLTTSTVFNDIDWDSLAVISTIALIDEHFDVMIPGQAISECKGIPELLKLLKSYTPD